MNNQQKNLSDIIASSMELTSRFTLREFLTKIFFRFRLFILCIFFVTLSSLFFTWLVPPVYKSTAKILIRYDSVESPFFSEISTPRRQLISGQSNAEILRSLPVSQRVVQELGVSNDDIARPAYKVILSKLAKPFYWLFREDQQGSDPTGQQAAQQVAEELKKTINVNIVQKSKTTLNVSDELLEISISSTNREKVSGIANSFYESFVEEYYSMSENEAKRAKQFLEIQYRRLLNETDGKISTEYDQENYFNFDENGDRSLENNRAISDLVKNVSELEMNVNKLKFTYKENSPKLLEAQNELNNARHLLARQMSEESGKALLRIYKQKLRQIAVSLQIYKNHLIPISLVEPAVPPKKSFMMIASRYFLNGSLGLIGGFVLAIGLILLLSNVDQNLNTAWDVSRQIGYPVLESLPKLKELNVEEARPEQMPFKETFHAFVSILGTLEASGHTNPVVTITSTGAGAGKTFTALQLATAMARDKRTKVLFIDGNIFNPEATRMLVSQSGPGLVELLKGEIKTDQVLKSTSIENLKILPVGINQDRMSLGFFRKSLTEILTEIRNEFNMIIIDSPAVLSGTDTSIFSSVSDCTLMVIKAGETQREPLRKAISALEQSGCGSLYTILNCRLYPVPKFLYRLG